MATKNYCNLIDQLCALANMPHSPSRYESTNLEVNEIKFTLIDASTPKEDGQLVCPSRKPRQKNSMNALAAYAAQAKVWRQSYFLLDDEGLATQVA